MAVSMEGLQITRAERREAKLRFFLSGRSGAGKSTTLVLIAARIAERENVPMIYIDSEEGSADKLAEALPGFSFDKIELQGWKYGYSPTRYQGALRMALDAGAGVIIIDSISQGWEGKGGVMEQVDDERARNRNPDKQAAWSVGTKLWNDLVADIVGAPAHILLGARSKTIYDDLPDERTGRLKRVAVGTTYIARPGFEYEFDFFGDMEREGHVLTFDKNRSMGAVKDEWTMPGLDLGDAIYDWLKAGGADITMRTRELKQLQKPGVTGAMVADALKAAGLTGKDDFLDDQKFRVAREVVRGLQPPSDGAGGGEEPTPATPTVPVAGDEAGPAVGAPEAEAEAPVAPAAAPAAPASVPTKAELNAMTVVQLKKIATERGLVQPGESLKKADVVERILTHLTSSAS